MKKCKKSYIVAYIIRTNTGVSVKDHYVVFCEGTRKQNKKEAYEFLEVLKGREDLYSANVTKIQTTTEHYE